MAKPEPKKRKLKYANFDEMMADVRSLCDNGYISNGNWNLGQATNHVAEWMRFPMDGFPKPPLPIAMIMWVMKHTVGPGMKRKIFAEGFKGGMMTAPETVIEPDKISDTDGVEKLQQIADRLSALRAQWLLRRYLAKWIKTRRLRFHCFMRSIILVTSNPDRTRFDSKMSCLFVRRSVSAKPST